MADGWTSALTSAALGGGAVIATGYLKRDEALTRMGKARRDGAAAGASAAKAYVLFDAVVIYQACVFPLSSDTVPEAERSARRDAAYRLAAREDLAQPVREAAANALAAIDQGSRPATVDAVRALLSVVHVQTTQP
ncbi:hypothetical protein ACWGA9_32285 [Streptomyces sp. NPDC054950]